VICSAQIFNFVSSLLLISNLLNQSEYPVHTSKRRNTSRSITHIGHNSSSNCPLVSYLPNTSISKTQLQNNITSVLPRLMSTTEFL